MDTSFIDGKKSAKGTICNRCGRPLTDNSGACLETQTRDECICEDCYRNLLMPGDGDAHGNMS